MKFKLLTLYALAVLAGSLVQAHAADPVTVVFQNGINGYEGTFDRRIGPGGEIDGSLVSGQTTYYLDGGANALNDSGFTQGLIRFGDIETLIPAGAKIVDAKITTVTKTHGNARSPDSFNVYRLTRGFDSASSVTTDFGADGIQGDIDWILGSFHGPNINAQASVVSADVTRAVQSWVDGSPNHGVGIRSDRGINGWSFHTTGSATVSLRPKLEVTYLLGDGVAASDFQQGLDGYSEGIQVIFNAPTPEAPPAVYTTVVGSTVQQEFLDGINPPTLEPDIPSMLRFGGLETQLAGRKIESATLKLVTGFASVDADSPGPFTVHRLLVPFTETSNYGDFAGNAGDMFSAGQITPAINAFIDMQGCEVVQVDVTAAVKSWAAGEANHGLYIGSGTSNGWQIFTTGANDTSFRPILRVVSSPTPPVEIVSPVASSRHVLDTSVSFEVNTSVLAPATVSQVEFFVDGVSVAVDTSPPYTFSYLASSLGNFVLTAVLTDSNSTVFNAEPVAFSIVPAAGSGGVYFDGLLDHVALGDAAELKLGTFTLETWFRRESSGVSTTTGTGGVVAIPLVAKGRNQFENSTLDTNWFLGIRESDGVLCADFEGAGGANVPVNGFTPITNGVWQHAAATFDGTEWRLYLNGNLEAVRDAGGLTPRVDSIQHASIATAMNSNGLGEGAFGGFMDEVRIWSVSRSHAEIRQGINKEIASATGLVARWGMTEGSGSTITSTATAATAGTFSGSPVWTSGFSFNNNIKPSISFLSPQEGANFIGNSPLQITVAANDPDGTPSQVEYFDNGISIGTSMTAPFTFTYNNPPVGTRRLVAEVTDNGGETSLTDVVLTFFVTFDAPTVPGYTAGIIDGGDAEFSTGAPAATPAAWSVLSSTAAPRAFGGPGTIPGDIAVNVNGAPLAFDTGILLTANTVVGGNFASIDNMVFPYEAGGVYRVSSMDNSGPGELDPSVSPESSSFAMGWFPYGDGWIGANLDANGAVISGSTSLPASVSITNTAAGAYQISGLPSSGNLIAVATGNANDNCATVAQSGEEWIVTVRDNSQNLENGDFAILYIPGTAERVLSGKIGNLGEFTALNNDLALLGVSTRLTSQGYELTFGDGSMINPSNTALFITADAAAGNGPDNIYSYSANGNSFVVFSHDLPGLNGILQNGGFRFLATPLDTLAPNSDEVVLSVTDAQAAEDGTDQTLAFTVTRLGSTDSALTVNYAVTGSATPGSDFTALPGSVVIPSGSASAQITVAVLADSLLEPLETVTVTLSAGAGYIAGLNITGTGTIQDALSTLPTSTLVFQEGLNGYSGQFQKRVGYALSSGTFTAQLGSSVASYGVDGGDPDINDLIRFDNIIGSGGIPVGAKVIKAELVLTTALSDNAQSSGPFIVDRLLSAVDENTTYDSISFGQGFEGVRGISTGLPVAGFPSLLRGQVGAADVTSIVREWASGKANHGFGIYSGGTTDGWNYGTVGNPSIELRPKLVVTYINQPTREYTYTTDRSARINNAPGADTIDGSTLDTEFIDLATNNTQEALMRFPVTFDDLVEGAIPLDEEIVKAELLVTTATAFSGTGTQSAGPFTLHQVLEDWTTATSYGLYGPRIGTQVGSSVAAISGLGQGSTTWIDVTSIVRNWRAGAANHGFNIKPGTGDEWMLFWPGTSFGADFQPRLRITTAGGSIPNETPFESWAKSFSSPGINLDSDDDRDGISALIEYALGLSPVAGDVLPGIVQSGGNISLLFTKGIQAAGDPRVAYRIMSSTDLVGWTPEASAVNGSSEISLNQPVGVGSKFFRLEVVYTP
ncbi:MAG: DNRLRE domain-containing protein [Akkermansiaceae bacterium]